MAVVSSGGSSSSESGGGKISFTAEIGSFRTDEAETEFCDEEEYDVEERSVTIDYYEDPPDETLRIVLCDGQTVAIQGGPTGFHTGNGSIVYMLFERCHTKIDRYLPNII